MVSSVDRMQFNANGACVDIASEARLFPFLVQIFFLEVL